MSSFDSAVAMYHKKFGETPTVVSLPLRAQERAIPVLLDAVENDYKLDDEEFFQLIGIEPPEDGMVL